MKIQTAIVGTGRIGFMLEEDPLRYHPCTHAGALKELNRLNGPYRFELTGAADLKTERLEQFKKWWGAEDLHTDTDYRKILNRGRTDLLIVSSSFHSHYEICRTALESGVGAVVLEKPAVNSIEEMKDLLHLSQEKNIPVWVNFERRYHNGYRKAKEIIESGEFGELRSVTGKVLTGPAKAGDEGSPVLLDGIHWLDILIWFFGVPEVSGSVKIKSAAENLHDTVAANLQMKDAQIFFEAGGRRKYFEFFLEMDFEKGRIRSGNEGHFFYRAAQSKRYAHFYELQEYAAEFTKNNPWLDMYDEIGKYVAEFPDARGSVTSPLYDSLLSLELLNEIMK